MISTQETLLVSRKYETSSQIFVNLVRIRHIPQEYISFKYITEMIF